MRNHVAARALLCCPDAETVNIFCTLVPHPQKAPRAAWHNRAPPARPATLRAAAPKGK